MHHNYKDFSEYYDEFLEYLRDVQGKAPLCALWHASNIAHDIMWVRACERRGAS